MADRPHDGESRTCWCEPELLQPCSECGGAPLPDDDARIGEVTAEPSDPDCWRCGGRGCVPMFDESEPVIIVHRYPDSNHG
jgi:hypothetical protein